MAARKSTGGAARVRTSDVMGFRLHAHHLTNRQPVDELHAVAGACGIQNSPPGSGLLALHARVEDVTQDRIDRLLDALQIRWEKACADSTTPVDQTTWRHAA